jgi:hypothetical protein
VILVRINTVTNFIITIILMCIMTGSPLPALTTCASFNFTFVLDACYWFVFQQDILTFRWWLMFVKRVQFLGYYHHQLVHTWEESKWLFQPQTSITVFTTALSCAISIQSTLSNPTPVKTTVIFRPHLHKYTQNIILLYMTMSMRCYMARPIHRSRYDKPNKFLKEYKS